MIELENHLATLNKITESGQKVAGESTGGGGFSLSPCEAPSQSQGH